MRLTEPLLLACTVALAIGLTITKSRLNDLVGELNTTGEALSSSRLKTVGLLDVVQRIPLQGVVLQGVEVGGDSVATIDTRDGIYYVLESTCAACALNLPALERLYSHGAPVVGVAPKDTADVLREYMATNQIGFPILARPSGALTDLIPTVGTPITIVIRHGKVADYHFGRIEESTLADLALQPDSAS